MYQFWLKRRCEVVAYLRYFTFLPPEEIDALARLSVEAPEKRQAQRVLAREVTRIVHGEAGLAEAEATTAEFFQGNVAGLSERNWVSATRRPLVHAAGGTGATVALVDRAGRWTGLLERGGRARLIQQGAVELNGQPGARSRQGRRAGPRRSTEGICDASQGQEELPRSERWLERQDDRPKRILLKRLTA